MIKIVRAKKNDPSMVTLQFAIPDGEEQNRNIWRVLAELLVLILPTDQQAELLSQFQSRLDEMAALRCVKCHWKWMKRRGAADPRRCPNAECRTVKWKEADPAEPVKPERVYVPGDFS